MKSIILTLLLLSIIAVSNAFNGNFLSRRSQIRKFKQTMILDSFAELAIAAKLSTSAYSPINFNSFPIAVTETKQGLYKEYTVDKVDDSKLDQVKRNYKTAEETEDSKTKYWVILGVLLFGSFTIPMVQYYWYVADED